MHWYRKHLLIIGFPIGLLVAQSCKSDNHPGANTGKFFDLKGYFEAEASRLNRLHPQITKVARHNSATETKQVKISDWKTELDLFSESDINKPAWKASYTFSDSDGILTYTAKDPDMKTRDIIVKKKGDKIVWLLIINHKRSTVFGKTLYESIEKLSYFPDSLYQVQKKQYVRLLGTNTYNIKGLFN